MHCSMASALLWCMEECTYKSYVRTYLQLYINVPYNILAKESTCSGTTSNWDKAEGHSTLKECLLGSLIRMGCLHACFGEGLGVKFWNANVLVSLFTVSTFLLENFATGMGQLSWTLAYSTAVVCLCMLETLVVFLIHKIQLVHSTVFLHVCNLLMVIC